MTEERASVRSRRKIPAIWIVPLVTALLGMWMVYYTWQNQGPEITLTFSTAEGIESGKTKIRARSVQVGLVTDVRLGEDNQSVIVIAELDRTATPLLREDTEFWVVRPRIGAGGISGLGTIVSGGYVELDPGVGKAGQRHFTGREDIPVTKVGTPGLKLSLTSNQAGSVGAGDTIRYRGFQVGRVESATFEVENRQIRYDAFIDAPYDALVTTSTRFWNASGLHFSATASGIELSTGSLDTLLLGGISFGLPDGVQRGGAVENRAVFALFPNEHSINEHPYRYSLEYVVEFDQSVRGLRPGAPVEYRGLPAGSVKRVMLREMVAKTGGTGQGAPIAVLIEIEPGRLEFGDTEAGRETLRRGIEAGVVNGMRASLASGNLLTGSLIVALDDYDDVKPKAMGDFAGYPTIPTTVTGLASLEHRVATLLDKLNALPLENVTNSVTETLREVERTVASLNAILASDDLRALPGSIDSTLTELDRTLRDTSSLVDSLEEEPSSIIFSREPVLDPIPPARSQ
jgi:paraquat-inducible protein B